MRILISGASIAGPVLAYWLNRYGFDVTVIERAAAPGAPGGHAVDLFRPALDISERMGVLPRIEARSMRGDRMTVYREGRQRPAEIDLGRDHPAAPDRHVEILRDDLSKIYREAARADVEYLFGDSITGIDHDGEVTFERAEPRRFDVVVGADGAHSTVRRLTFGAGAGVTRFLGGYLAVLSAPKALADPGGRIGHVGPGRFAGIYTAEHLDDARVVLLFRGTEDVDHDPRDTARQRESARAAFAGMHEQVDGWLAQLDSAAPFYCDAITQLRMDIWSRRRVTLVGDAGYSPGPAVGGSTSLAVLGAYVLAGELASADGDHLHAFAAYELRMHHAVHRSRAFARDAARSVVPASRAGAWALLRGATSASRAPEPLSRVLGRRVAKARRAHERMPVPDYGGADV
ncbi:FAD-dependent oxidoreductase [Mycobacterium sp. E2462]|uniref:FAD-dependent monooxygenase n=1 Tax=Mycobacterium sp. E2462 TaxID=1834133 RepID=UPI0008010302|nr:FAD-dependent monooxygenase [Mycobacterium sp. E2462]OBI04038.1 FAD-dependent oxidoreductase [Mycobacterium sp. E2462]